MGKSEFSTFEELFLWNNIRGIQGKVTRFLEPNPLLALLFHSTKRNSTIILTKQSNKQFTLKVNTRICCSLRTTNHYKTPSRKNNTRSIWQRGKASVLSYTAWWPVLPWGEKCLTNVHNQLLMGLSFADWVDTIIHTH